MTQELPQVLHGALPIKQFDERCPDSSAFNYLALTIQLAEAFVFFFYTLLHYCPCYL